MTTCTTAAPCAVLVLARLRQIVGDPEDALRGIVERRGEHLAHRDRRVLAREPEPGLEEAEVAAGRQRRAGEHHRVQPVEQQLPAARGARSSGTAERLTCCPRALRSIQRTRRRAAARRTQARG